MDFELPDITSLCKLFDEIDPDRRSKENNDDSDNEEEQVRMGFKVSAGPGDIGLNSKSSASVTASSKKEKLTAISKDAIWDSKEVTKEHGNECSFEEGNISITNDPRKSPIYNMHYRQCVTTEDVFLQMGNKTTGTASCENLVVEINLPEDDYQKVQLNLKKQAIDLRSPIHFLYLNLPHPIDPRAGNAKWDPESEKLTLTLKLVREFDDFNF